uniref:GRF-type domain-containing protein n=1 Tax=Brassica oleracea var. oleracea TaxID=109376 RepID=A0A0D3BLV7_BRAOL
MTTVTTARRMISYDVTKLSYAWNVVHYPPQPEVKFGFPQVCYCGTKPLLATSNTRQDQGRRYYTCAKKDDGECYVYKWWDEALMEEMRARDIHVLQLGEKVESLTLLTDYDTEQKIRNLEKIVGDMAKEKSSFSYGFECFVIGIVVLVVVIGLVMTYLKNLISIQNQKSAGRSSLTPLQKCTAAIRQLAFGGGSDTVDEYVRIGETIARRSLHNFATGIIHLFGDEYLRRPTPEDLQRLLYVGEQRGFPGMIGSIHCTLNDLNILDRSPVFDDIINGIAPQVNFYVNDGIYPKWTTFIQSIRLPQGQKHSLFAQTQEAVRKDVERAFGVLQARFAVVRNPSNIWDKEKIGNIMRACIILHNMIVEDERSSRTEDNVHEFEEREDVDTFSVNMPSPIVSTINRRTSVRNRQVHEHLKNDLIENIWAKFGHLTHNI